MEISAGAFLSNLKALKSLAGPAVQLMAVLKADAYGHGAEFLAPLAVKGGATWISVSSLEEGLALRSSGIKCPILTLGSIYPLSNFEVALKAKLTPMVASWAAARELERIARRLKKTAAFHMKVDTGMGRIGMSLNEAKKVLEWLRRKPALQLSGVFTHCSSADIDPNFTFEQLRRFQNLQAAVHDAGFTNVLFHMANSAALLRFPETHLNLVRPGIALYGAAAGDVKFAKLSPVLSWRTKVVFLKKTGIGTSISYHRTFVTTRESEIATLPVGYGDGYPRLLSNKGYVLIKGQRCPVVGRVTMDQIMVDVTGIKAKVGDDVMLIGKQGSEEITVHDVADWAQTIPYEIFCGITKRVPRVEVK